MHISWDGCGRSSLCCCAQCPPHLLEPPPPPASLQVGVMSRVKVLILEKPSTKCCLPVEPHLRQSPHSIPSPKRSPGSCSLP